MKILKFIFASFIFTNVLANEKINSEYRFFAIEGKLSNKDFYSDKPYANEISQFTYKLTIRIGSKDIVILRDDPLRTWEPVTPESITTPLPILPISRLTELSKPEGPYIPFFKDCDSAHTIYAGRIEPIIPEVSYFDDEAQRLISFDRQFIGAAIKIDDNGKTATLCWHYKINENLDSMKMGEIPNDPTHKSSLESWDAFRVSIIRGFKLIESKKAH